ncbi:MAG: TonB-dependent receptor domain-containing protein [Blastocatellia bacterium]
MKRTNRVLLLIALLALIVGNVLAQTGTSRITGTVTDPSGAVLPNAKVTARNEATGVTFSAQTNSSGSYSFDSLPVGSYEVKVEAAGFRTYSSTANILTVGSPLVVDVPMQVGATTEVVSVQGAYERLATTNAALGDVIERKTITELPLNGRNPLSLITLQPGLVQRTSAGAGSGTHVNGSRDRAFNVTIDGIDANEPSVPNPQSNVYRLNPDNVQEYRVTTHNATPEQGRNSGANVAIATRGGTNEIHGTLFHFFRNTALNANEFFNNAQKFQALAQGNAGLAERFNRPELKLNQFGGEVGGPIIKNRTHYFGSYQNQRVNVTQPIARSFGIPILYTPEARAGIFRYFVGAQNRPAGAAGAVVDANGKPLFPDCSASLTTNCIRSYNIYGNDPRRIGADPVVKAYLDRYPTPNSYTVGDGLNTAGYAWNVPSRTVGPNYMFRIDHTINDRQSVFGRYIDAATDTLDGDLLNSRPSVFPGYPPLGEVFRSSKNTAIGHRWTITDNIVNEFTVGLARFRFYFTWGESNPDFPNIPPFDFATISEPVHNIPRTQRTLNTYQVVDNLSWVKGAHVVRTGVNFRFLQHNDLRGFAGFNIAPSLTFDGAVRAPSWVTSANVPGINSVDNTTLLNAVNNLLGVPARLTQAFVSDPTSDSFLPTGNIFNSGTRYKQFNYYLQDEWKLSQKLTVNYGFRWEVNLPATEAFKRVFVPSRRPDIFDASNLVTWQQSQSWYENATWKAVAPRLSFAYAKNDKTVIRAGFGMAYDPISTFQVTSIAGFVPGLVTRVQPLATTVDANKRVAEGFPLQIAPPTTKPSSFYAPAVARQGTAPSLGAFDQNIGLPTSYDWNLNIQRELPLGMVAQVGYVGKRGTHLLRGYNLNQTRVNSDAVTSFNRLKANFAAGCTNRALGTGCQAGYVAQPVGVLLQLSDAAFLNSAATTTDLQQNALGNLTTRIDTNFDIWTRGVPANYFRPNPQFSSLFYLDSGGDSYYHGLQATLRRRFEKGFSFGLAYTFSKSIDNMSVDPVGAASGGGLSTTNSRTATDIYDWNIDRAVSDFDRRHVLVVNGLWELPFGKGKSIWGGANGFVNQIIGGWSLNGILFAMTGQPFQVQSGALTAHNGKVSRADIIGAAPEAKLRDVPGILGPVIFTSADLAQFGFPAAGSNGLQSRNTFRGPGYVNLDLGLFKNFSITERFKLQFRAEFFNALNHANFESPRDASNGSTLITSTLFGRTCCVAAATPSSANVIATGESARVIQFGLKLSF